MPRRSLCDGGIDDLAHDRRDVHPDAIAFDDRHDRAIGYVQLAMIDDTDGRALTRDDNVLVLHEKSSALNAHEAPKGADDKRG